MDRFIKGGRGLMAELEKDMALNTDTETGGFFDDTETVKEEIPKEKKSKKFKSPFKGKKRTVIACIAVITAIALLTGIAAVTKSVKKKNSADNMFTDTEVVRANIENAITGSSHIEPNDSYKVATIKSGDINKDYFKEGDKVKKGDKLYQFDDEDARNALSSAQNSLTKAQQSYSDAVKQKSITVSSNNYATNSVRNGVEKAQNALKDAERAYNDCYPKADFAGKVAEVYVKDGDNVSNGARLMSVYNDRYMKIRLPFNEFDAENVYVGAAAQLNVVGSSDELWGSVTEVSSASVVGDAHTMLVYATIELDNPGALSTRDVGSAVVNGVACSDTANYEYINEADIISKASGKVCDLSVSDGDAVYGGQTLCRIESDSVNTSLLNARLSYSDAVAQLEKQVLNNDTFSQDSSIKNAQLGLEDAKLSVKKAQDTVNDYLIEAPIDGTVVTKNAKAGDTIDSQNNSEPLCVIYDLSRVKFTISVDETEIALVKVGQDVIVTADACRGTFMGKITKVPVDGVNENGVTTYTVEVEIENYGDLLPGMNCNARVIVEQAQDVLTVPVSSVNRGNIVFVKEDGKKRPNDVTDRIKENKENQNNNDNKDNKEDKNGKKGDKSEQSASPLPTMPARGEGGNMPSGSGSGASSGMSGNMPSGSGSGASSGMSGNMPSGSGSGAPSGTRGNMPSGNGSGMPSGNYQSGGMRGGAAPTPRPKSAADIDTANIPMNIEVPDGYRAVVVATGINDTQNIEIVAGLDEGDIIRTINTMASSENASFGMGGGMYGGMNGGMYRGGSMGGGMYGGGMYRGGSMGGGMGGSRYGR